MWRLLKRFEQQTCISSSKPSEEAKARMGRFMDYLKELRQLN